MKGIVLAGGTGSRLYPLTKVTNKHLLPVGRKPMIYYPIEKLTEAGLDDILIITGIEHMGDVVSLLGSGREFGCQFTYRVQDEAGGIAQALGLAENFCHGEPCAVILGDNIFEDTVRRPVEEFRSGAHIFLKEVENPAPFGVAEVDEQGNVLAIEEKPEKPKSDYVVAGVYLYDAQVFDIIKGLKPSSRGELEITDVNNFYIGKGEMQASFLEGYWSDAGTFESLKHAGFLIEEE
jgi:glucose-1-phosphate thymidylyltransferase